MIEYEPTWSELVVNDCEAISSIPELLEKIIKSQVSDGTIWSALVPWGKASASNQSNRQVLICGVSKEMQ